MRYRLEYIGLMCFHGLCRLLPPLWASGFGGWVLRNIGRYLGANKKAVRHIIDALHCDEATAEKIAADMWDNLGRALAEYPQLKSMAENNTRFVGIEHLQAMQNDGKPGVLFGAHLGNWEVLPHALLHHVGLRMHPVYRAPNNPYVDKKLHEHRAAGNALTPYPKSRQGMIGMVKALRSGEHLGLLIDQKYNGGVVAQFFGMPAKTGTAFIELAQKYDCPLVPLRCVREKNGFLVEALPPIETKGRSVDDILNETHGILEGWITEHPGQWLWLHRRWMHHKKSKKRKKNKKK